LALVAAAAASIGLEHHKGRATFRLLGIEAPRAEFFAVYVDGPGSPPILGSCRRDGSALIFEPRFPLQPGMRYRAVYTHGSGEPVTGSFDIPKPVAKPSTVVEHVYPSASRLPENQLKFYIHFSAPMSRGEAYRRIRLLDETGQTVQLPFLELDEELWDHDWKRLTLFFDPGRIKRGLLPNEEAGTPLKQGGRYTLVIDRDWPDASGRPLQHAFRKSFQVGPPDREPLDPKKWRVTPTLQSLVVEFPEPIDRALLDRLLEVIDSSGQTLAGSIEVDREETRWRFTPRDRWTPGDYVLRVGTALEDLAGNKIGRAFEVDVFERVEQEIRRETIDLPFRVPLLTNHQR
jgi:hypothetical protein